MTRKEIIRFLVLKSIGNFLILFALYGVGATFGPALYFELAYQLHSWQGVHYTVADAAPFGATNVQTSTAPSLFVNSQNQLLIPKDTQFSILIPKIGANSQVFANVDPSNPDNYLPILKKGVAHARGTALPGEPGTIYLFAHSTDNFWDVGLYNAVFYLLKNLNQGDSVTLFYLGKRYDYTVSDTKIVDPSDVSFITDSRTTKSQLVLQTCWPPGTTWKRLLVIAKPSQ